MEFITLCIFCREFDEREGDQGLEAKHTREFGGLRRLVVSCLLRRPSFREVLRNALVGWKVGGVGDVRAWQERNDRH